MKVTTYVDLGQKEVEIEITGADAALAILEEREGYDPVAEVKRITNNFGTFFQKVPDETLHKMTPSASLIIAAFFEDQARRLRKIPCALPLLFCLLLAGVSLGQTPALTTRAYDNARTGANTRETVLTASAVAQRGIVRLTTIPVAGDARGMEAQPLIQPSVKMQDGSTHDVMVLPSMANVVRGVDAATGAGLWQVVLGNPVTGSARIDFHQINQHWGVLSTGVLDPEAGVVYLVAWVSPDGTPQWGIQWVYALHVRDGSQAAPPVSLANVTDGNQRFASAMRKQRSSLVLTNVGGVKTVFFASGSVMETAAGSAGWVVAYDVATHSVSAALAMSKGQGAGVWMAGQGLAADAQGFLYGISGNGGYNGVTDFGEAVFKLQYTPATTAVSFGRTVRTAATLKVVDSWAPFSDAGRVGLDPTLSAPPGDLPPAAATTPKLAGMSAPSEEMRGQMQSSGEAEEPHPVGASMGPAMRAGATRTVMSNDDRGMPVALVYPKNPTDPAWSDEDFGSAGGTLILEYGVYLAAGKDGIAYPVNAREMGHTRPTDFANTHGNCAKLKAPPVWVASYVAGVDPCAQDARVLNFLPDGKTRHIHATPVQYRSPTRGLTLFVWGENSTLHAWTMAANGQMNYLAQGDAVASANVQGSPGGMPGGFCSLSSNGNALGSAVLWCSIPYGDANATVTTGRLLAYDAEDLQTNRDGTKTLRVLWDSERWNVTYVFNKFMPPVVWNGRVYLPNYGGGVEVFGLAGGER